MKRSLTDEGTLGRSASAKEERVKDGDTHFFVVRDHSPRDVSTSLACLSNKCLCCASFKKKSLCLVPEREGACIQQ